MILTKRRISSLGLALASAMAASLVTLAIAGGPDGDRAAFTVSRIHTSNVTDLSDDRRLAGVVDSLFVGRVVSQRSQTVIDKLPETQWAVEVLKVYKSSPEVAVGKHVIVNQQGGYDEESNTLLLHEGDNLVESGGVYLFATKTYAARGWHTLVPRYGNLPLGDVTQKEQVTTVDARWRSAVANQIPFTTG